MKHLSTISYIMLAIAVVIGFSIVAVQQQDNNELETQLNKTKNEKKQVQKDLKAKTTQNQVLADQIDTFKQVQNNKDKSISELEFNQKANKFIQAMFTFEPNSYSERKDKVKGLITDKLFNDFFPKNQNFGDSNNVTSKLDKVKIYTRSKQGKNIDGLAVINFESKSGDNEFKKQTVLYQLTYDTTAKQLSKVKSLGTSFEASDIQ